MTRIPRLPATVVFAVAAILPLLAPSSLAAQGAALGAVPPLAVRAGTGAVLPLLREVTVSGPEVRLGDIFAAAGARADQVVASAPAAGASLTLDALTLMRLARAYGIDWQPRSAAEQVVIGRDEGVLVDGRFLAEPILAALAGRGLDLAGIEVSLNETDRNLRLPATASLGVERLTYRPPARAFAAVLKATDGDRLIRRISVSGEIRRPASLPVLSRALARGETIAPVDLRWIEADEARLPGNAVVVPEAMVGLTVRRDLKAGQPILAKDLAKPLVIEKNAAVTLILARPGMQLTARGRALADAALGDTVSVANLQTNLVVAGIVTAPGTVTVNADAGAAVHALPAHPPSRAAKQNARPAAR